MNISISFFLFLIFLNLFENSLSKLSSDPSFYVFAVHPSSTSSFVYVEKNIKLLLSLVLHRCPYIKWQIQSFRQSIGTK
jgi:hypothetical protein